MDEILDITLALAETFERLGIPYLVGGSLASSLHGLPRATQDVDIVVRMQRADVPPLASELRGQFYLDEDAIDEAVEHRRSFNLIHLGSYFKADVFVAGEDEASMLQMERRRRFDLGGANARTIVVASAEDVIAQKLYWFALGDEVSERQWSDAAGVIKVGSANLDWAYLLHVARLLNVEGLLRRIAAETGVDISTHP